jgi:hypothetical protein
MEINVSTGIPDQLAKLYPAQADLLTGFSGCLASSDLPLLPG